MPAMARDAPQAGVAKHVVVARTLLHAKRSGYDATGPRELDLHLALWLRTVASFALLELG